MKETFVFFVIIFSNYISHKTNGQILFNTSVYEEVTREPLKDYGALQKCGENERQGIDVCVPYYNCDPDTRTVIQNGIIDGSNIIEIRFTLDYQCDHYLDICCQIPSEENSTSSSTPSSTTLFTSPTVVSTIESRTIRTTGKTTTSKPNIEENINDRIDDAVIGGTWLDCGIRNPNGIDFKISGKNNEAEYGEFPWQVAILRKNFNKNLHKHKCVCGGSLIRSNVVLTAAHCVRSFNPSELTVRAGEWDTQTTKERIPHQERLVKRIIIHENYGIENVINDVAILELERSFIKVKSIGTICLPKTNRESLDTKHCFASGWGKTNFEKKDAPSVFLKKIELSTVESSKCQQMLRKTRLGPYFKLHDSFMCAGGEEGKDTCTGDGGSPLVCPDYTTGKYTQVGIVSWGVGCGKNEVPGVYSDVFKAKNWINEKLKHISR